MRDGVADSADSGLAPVLKATRYEKARLVRIRTNHEHASVWKLDEWDLTAKTPIAPEARLEGQIAKTFFVTAPNVTVVDPAYQALWESASNLVPPVAVPVKIPASLLEPGEVTYGPFDATLPTPPGSCAPEATRNTLALVRCTGCHFRETNTAFTHISNRTVDGKSELSGFLKGNVDDPTVAAIYLSDPSQMFTADVTYETFKNPGNCAERMKKTINRSYYDLGRRRMFLAAVLNASPTEGQAEADKIQAFSADFAH